MTRQRRTRSAPGPARSLDEPPAELRCTPGGAEPLVNAERLLRVSHRSLAIADRVERFSHDLEHAGLLEHDLAGILQPAPELVYRGRSVAERKIDLRLHAVDGDLPESCVWQMVMGPGGRNPGSS